MVRATTQPLEHAERFIRRLRLRQDVIVDHDERVGRDDCFVGFRVSCAHLGQRNVQGRNRRLGHSEQVALFVYIGRGHPPGQLE